jgi:endoglycosylceramidase
VTSRARLALLLLVSLFGCGDGQRECPSPVVSELLTLQLRAEGGRLRDDGGREVLLRGVNAGGRAKFAPFFPFPFAESGLPEQAGAPAFDDAAAEYVDRVAAWGANAVRLPFTWEAVEPTRGTYDTVYLDRLWRLARAFGYRGIRVIVDAHQDVFSRPYCGDGFPPWACPAPVPDPPADCSGWFQGYLQPSSAASVAFGRFWANEDGLRDAFRAMWQVVAQQLGDAYGVIGFEVLNEPYEGAANEQTWAVETLKPFYEEVAAAIREVAPGALVFFDANGTAAATATTAVVPPDGDRFVFAPHYYNPTSQFDGMTHDPVAIDDDLGRWAAKRDEWGVPVFVGEFGIKPAFEDAAGYVRDCYAAFDHHLLHATQWEYSTTADDWNGEAMSVTGAGGAETVLVPELVRAYPRAVGGTITSFTYDPNTRKGELVYQAVAGVITEVAAPVRLYPDGVSGRVGGVGGCTFSGSGADVLWAVADRDGEARLTFGPR